MLTPTSHSIHTFWGDLYLGIKWSIYFRFSSFLLITKEYILVTSKKVRRPRKSLNNLPPLHQSLPLPPRQTAIFPSTSSSTFLHVFHVLHTYTKLEFIICFCKYITLSIYYATYHNLFYHSPVDGHSSFQCFTMSYKAIVNILVHTSLCTGAVIFIR